MREKIGEETSWQVEFIPGRFERIEHVRIKYACREFADLTLFLAENVIV